MASNFALEGFVLSEDDMNNLEVLDRGLRLSDPGQFCPVRYDTECPIWD